MVDDWWQSAPGKIAAPPTLSWESGAKKCGDLSDISILYLNQINDVNKVHIVTGFAFVYSGCREW